MKTPLPVGLSFAPVLAALQNACFPEEPWSAEAIAALMTMPGTFALLQDDGGEPAAFLLMRSAGGEAEVLSLGCIPAFRRRGHCRQLLRAGIAECLGRGAAVSAFLEVAEDNTPARALYDEIGFVAVGQRPAYYQRGSIRVSAVILKFSQPHGSQS